MILMNSISLAGLSTIPEVQAGDDIANLISQASKKEAVQIVPGDIVVIASKIVSKSEGSIVELKNVKPSSRSKAIARLTGKNPIHVELIRQQSKRIVAAVPIFKISKYHPPIVSNLAKDKEQGLRVLENENTLLITEVKHGLASDAGIDYSNNTSGFVTVLPVDAQESASRIRKELMRYVEGDLAVIITDTEIAFTHMIGSTEIAVGYSGIRPRAGNFGSVDRFGREKFGGVDIIVDEVACAAALLMGQACEGVPVVIIHGLKYDKDDVKLEPNMNLLRRAIWLTILASIKLRFSRLLEPFMKNN